MTDTTVEAPATPRLKQKYNEQIVPELEVENCEYIPIYPRPN